MTSPSGVKRASACGKRLRSSGGLQLAASRPVRQEALAPGRSNCPPALSICHSASTLSSCHSERSEESPYSCRLRTHGPILRTFPQYANGRAQPAAHQRSPSKHSERETGTSYSVSLRGHSTVSSPKTDRNPRDPNKMCHFLSKNSWHFSYAQTAILNIGGIRGDSQQSQQATSPLLTIIWKGINILDTPHCN
jgi:hypothetical protein